MLTERLDVTAAELQPGDYPVEAKGARVKRVVIRASGNVFVVLSTAGKRDRVVPLSGATVLRVDRPIPQSRQMMNTLNDLADAEESQ
jgi:hypothetical protein